MWCHTCPPQLHGTVTAPPAQTLPMASLMSKSSMEAGASQPVRALGCQECLAGALCFLACLPYRCPCPGPGLGRSSRGFMSEVRGD